MQTLLATVTGLTGILIGMTTGGWAQEAPQEVTAEEVVVTATKTETPITEVASSVYVIDSKMIEDKKAVMVLDVLRDAPGLQVVQSGGLGGQTSVFLRGGNSNFTLVLIDGVRMNSPTTGVYDFSNLTTDNIERIEVIYGPQSTLYGSDAIGGVIQIITKKGKEAPHGYVFGEGGSFETLREGGGIWGATEFLDYSLEVSHISTDGISKADANLGNSERDGYNNFSLSSRIDANFLGDGRIDFLARYYQSKTDLDGFNSSFVFADDPNLVQKNYDYSFSTIITKPLNDWWTPRLTLSYYDDKIEANDPDTPSNDGKTTANQYFIDWQNTFNIVPYHLIGLMHSGTMVAGYEYYGQKGNFQSAFGNYDATDGNNALYFQLQHDIAKQFFATAGVRHDINSHFGDKWTYKADLAYLLPVLDGKIHANYGTGFRAPTMNDLSFPGFNNPNLQPEDSQSYEFGLSLSPVKNTFSMGATYFYNTYANLIQAGPPPLFLPDNIGKARSQGASVDAAITPIRQVSLKANYTYLWTKDLDTNQDLLRRPNNKVNILLEVVPIDRLHINTDIQYVSSRADFGGRVGAYALVGMAATYDVIKHVQVYAKIDNLLDRDYEEINGYGTYGRSVYGGAKVSF